MEDWVFGDQTVSALLTFQVVFLDHQPVHQTVELALPAG